MHRDRLWTFQYRYAPYFFIAPFIVLFCGFMLYPLGRSAMLSFYKAIGPQDLKFTGLDNYRFMIHDKLFWIAVANTVLYTIGYLTIQIPTSLGLALMLNSRLVRWRSFFRFAFFSPILVGQVFVAVIFSLLLAQRQGLVNSDHRPSDSGHRHRKSIGLAMCDSRCRRSLSRRCGCRWATA